MRQAVEFLLERMDTHPEEFHQHRPSGVKHHWCGLINDNKKFFTEEEAEAIKNKLSAINMDRFAQSITERLLAPDEVELTGFGDAPRRAEGQQVAYALQNRYEAAEIQAHRLAHQQEILEHHMKTHFEALGEL